MGHGHFLNSTGDKGSIKRQRYATLAFLKIDIRHKDSPSRAPVEMDQVTTRRLPRGRKGPVINYREGGGLQKGRRGK